MIHSESILGNELPPTLRCRISGRVIEVCGPIVRTSLIPAAIGDWVEIQSRGARPPVAAEVVGFSEDRLLLGLHCPPNDILPGAAAILTGNIRSSLPSALLGGVFDGLGNVLQPGIRIAPQAPQRLARDEPTIPSPLARTPVTRPFVTGIRAIDGLLTIGCGQRLCVLAEPGCGKSSLLAMIARNSSAAANVIALVGERGREVGELLREVLTPETRRRTVMVISTSDEAPLRRIAAAATATRIAEHFREQGLDVLLQIDSLTRYLRALREVGLAAGELPVRRGYPPSVFTSLPRLIERAGTGSRGSITAFYTVLLSSDLDEDPMIDEIKGLTDGHIVLSKRLASVGHFPAIDVTASLSRLASRLLEPQVLTAAASVRSALVKLDSDTDILRFGGSADEDLERALNLRPRLESFLTQGADESNGFEETLGQLLALAA
ncbi:MAG: FliI/YscN family ATPase [Bdellovibrionota bacterium]